MNTMTSTQAEDLAALIQTNSGSKRKRRWIVLLVVIVLAAIGFVIQRGRKGDGLAPQYVTTPVERGDLSLTVTATGNIEPTNKVTVGSELSGTALEVLVQTNDRVTKGQALAKLDTRKLSQQAASNRASLASAKAKVAQARA